MTYAAHPTSSRPPQPHRWTADEFVAIGAAGLLPREVRFELINGQVIETSPTSPPHDSCIAIVDDWLRSALPERADVRIQSSVRLSESYQPVPDVAVAQYRADRYATRHPGGEDLLLLVEVSLTSLDFDRNQKATAYAAHGVREYWIVNLIDRQLERHLLPDGADTYPEPEVFAEGASLEHPRLGRVAVADLLPMRADSPE